MKTSKSSFKQLTGFCVALEPTALAQDESIGQRVSQATGNLWKREAVWRYVEEGGKRKEVAQGEPAHIGRPSPENLETIHCVLKSFNNHDGSRLLCASFLKALPRLTPNHTLLNYTITEPSYAFGDPNPKKQKYLKSNENMSSGKNVASGH